MERKEKIDQIIKERERQRLEVHQKKWSRREEQDFYRTVSTYGVEYDRVKNRYAFESTKIKIIPEVVNE